MKRKENLPLQEIIVATQESSGGTSAIESAKGIIENDKLLADYLDDIYSRKAEKGTYEGSLQNLDEATKTAQNLSIAQDSEFKFAITNDQSVLWGIRYDNSIYDNNLSDQTKLAINEIYKSIGSLDFATQNARKLSIAQDSEFKFAITEGDSILWGIRHDSSIYGNDLSDKIKTTLNYLDQIISTLNSNITDIQTKFNFTSNSEFLFCISNQADIPIWGITHDFSIYQATKKEPAPQKIIRAIGDSLTMGAGANQYPNYCYWLQHYLGDEFHVQNHGVGGEDSLSIAARMGMIPMYIDNETFTLSGGSSQSDIILKSVFDNSVVTPLKQTSIHMRVYIQGEEFRLGINRTTNNYTIERLNLTGQIIIPKGTIVIPAHTCIAPYLDIIWVGTNDLPLTSDNLLSKLKLMEKACPNKSIFIGVAKRGSNDVDLSVIENNLQREFGSRFINIREYLITNALPDAGITPTAQDLTDIANGIPPASLRNDATHYNEHGQKVIAKFVADRINQLTAQRILPIY